MDLVIDEDDADVDVGRNCTVQDNCDEDEPVLGYVALCGHSEHLPDWTGSTHKDLELTEADVTLHLSNFPSHQPFAVYSDSAQDIILCWQMQDMEKIGRADIP